jgi:2-methylcitrate dehydratase PrpD
VAAKHAAVTGALAEWVAASSCEALPAAVRRDGARALVNWVGCAAGGAHEPVVAQAIDFLSEFNGARDATLVARAEKLDALNAAYINTLASTVLMFNDTHAATVAHPTGPVAAALLALAGRQPLPGREFLHALIVGIEVQCRMRGRAVNGRPGRRDRCRGGGGQSTAPQCPRHRHCARTGGQSCGRTAAGARVDG